MSLEDELQQLHETRTPEREISLGTATILGIFFLLALLCAGFFGFGYSLGRRSAQAAVIPGAAAPREETKQDTPFSNFKNSPAPVTAKGIPSAEIEPQATSGETHSPASGSQKPDTGTSQSPAANLASDTAPAVGTGEYVVQVSAPTFQKDADHLVTVLKQQGYVAFVRRQGGDQYFHVQIGPYATKAEAEVIRKKLETDGYKLPFIPPPR